MPIINTIIKDKAPEVEALPVTPSVQAQTIQVPQNKDGYNPINVSAVTSSIDSNIVASNIKNGVTILGVTGNYTGGTGPVYYVEKAKNVNNSLVPGSNLINLTGITDFDEYVLYYAYAGSSISGNVDLSSVTNITGTYALSYAFYGCTSITGVDLSGLTQLSGGNALACTFQNCTGITSIDVSNLATVTGTYALSSAFEGCTGLTGVVDLSGFISSTASGVFTRAFYGCTGITGVDLRNMTAANGYAIFTATFYNCTNLSSVNMDKVVSFNSYQATYRMFYGCTGLTTITLPSLESIQGYNAAYGMFEGCRNLTTVKMPVLKTIKQSNATSFMFSYTNVSSLYFPSLGVDSFDTSEQFSNALQGVTGCTVHFPIAIQSTIGSWSSITNGMGGTNTTILFDIVTSLTGADTLVYTRREKDSTSSAIAWENNGALYYTSGTTEPVVGDTIYGDDTCTTAVTTVAAIA